jgi:hypothetical protein
MRNALRFAALLALVFALLAPAAHVLEIPGKLRLEPEQWLMVQQTLYAAFPVAGALGYVGAPLVVGAFAWAARDNREAHAAWVAVVLVVLALLSWVLIVAPVNTRIAAATPETLPDDWTTWRLRWEAGHALATLLIASGLVVLLRAALREAHPRAARTAAARSEGQA